MINNQTGNIGGIMSATYNIYDLKKAIDEMVRYHEQRIDSMTTEVQIEFDNLGVIFKQKCAYPECYPNFKHVDFI